MDNIISENIFDTFVIKEEYTSGDETDLVLIDKPVCNKLSLNKNCDISSSSIDTSWNDLGVDIIAERRKRLSRQRSAKYRASQKPDAAYKRRLLNAERIARRRANETLEETERRRKLERFKRAQKLKNETPAQTEERKLKRKAESARRSRVNKRAQHTYQRIKMELFQNVCNRLDVGRLIDTNKQLETHKQRNHSDTNYTQPYVPETSNNGGNIMKDSHETVNVENQFENLSNCQGETDTVRFNKFHKEKILLDHVKVPNDIENFHYGYEKTSSIMEYVIKEELASDDDSAAECSQRSQYNEASLNAICDIKVESAINNIEKSPEVPFYKCDDSDQNIRYKKYESRC